MAIAQERWPQPLGRDLTVDDRDSGQLEQDQRRRDQQVTLLIRAAKAAPDDDEVLDRLVERRTEKRRGVVDFEDVDTPSGQRALVVRHQLILRTPAGDGGIDAPAQRILNANGFQPAPGTFRDDGECADLLARVQAFTSDDASNAKVLDAVKELTDAGFAAAPTAVYALHAPPPVVKNLTGPARTKSIRGTAGPLEKIADRVVVAVIDTGIDEYRRADGWLADVDRDSWRIDPLDAFGGAGGGPNDLLDFAAGHGTFAGGIIRQVDPEAEIRFYAALESDGVASEIDVACAMVRAVRDGAHVVNLSLGMRTFDDQPSLAFEAALDLIDEWSEHPDREAPVIVASAGNYGSADPVWPAASRRVLSVAGLTAGLDPADWSSRGVWVDCSTVGEGIVSTFVQGKEDSAFGGTETYPADSWALWSGTSFAAPQIAGAISWTARNRSLTPTQAARWVVRSGTPIRDFGRAVHLLPGT